MLASSIGMVNGFIYGLPALSPKSVEKPADSPRNARSTLKDAVKPYQVP